MSDQTPRKNQEIFVATILMALFSSGLCALGGVIYLLAQWNNPIWDLKVRVFFIVGVGVFTGLAILLGFLYQKWKR